MYVNHHYHILSPKSQILTLLTSSPSAFTLRPPAPFTRPPRRRISRQFHSPPSPRSSVFLVKASLSPPPNSVFIFFAFAAFAVAYFNYFLKNRKKESSSATSKVVQVDEKVVNGVVEDRIVDSVDVHNGTALRELKLRESELCAVVGNEVTETEFVSDGLGLLSDQVLVTGVDEIRVSGVSDYSLSQGTEVTDLPLVSHTVAQSGVVQLPTSTPEVFEENNSLDDGLLLDAESDLVVADRDSGASNGSVSPRNSEAIELPNLPIAVAEPDDVHPTALATEVLEKDMKENESSAEHSLVTVDTRSVASVVTETNAHTEVNERVELHYGLVNEDDLTSYMRERSKNQSSSHGKTPLLKSAPVLDGIKAISSHASPFSNFSLSSPKRKSELTKVEVSAQDSVQTSEYIEGKLSSVSHKEGTSNKRKDRDGGFSRNKGSKHLMQDKSKSVLRTPYPNGINANDTHQQLSIYNRLLRDGRLIDCVDLLEDMDKKNLLDMNNVYHARFFNTCKSRKATKEAFRFYQLIAKPTLSTFNMLMSVYASSQDLEGAFQVLQLVQEAGLTVDCKLYTTLITTAAKSGKVDAMFEVFHEMVNAGVEPNIHTYGALIDGCAKAGQVAKAFGAYGFMRSKNVKPDRVVFNALITACGQAGAVDRAFDVLAEMGAETQPVDPDHITIGALMKACSNAGQVDRAREVYKMIDKYKIKGTPEVYTIAVNCSSQIGDWEFASNVYADMKRKGVVPDEVFYSALIDVAGHAGKLDSAFEILEEAKREGIRLGIVSYSSLMGASSNAKNWQKALEVYENMKSIKLKPSVSTMNALVTALCDGAQLPKAIEVLSEMKRLRLSPNIITYSVLTVASERMDDIEVGQMLLSQAKQDGVAPNLVMYKCVIGMCLRRYRKARTLGEPVLSNSGRPQIENKWTSLALTLYREIIIARHVPTMDEVSQILECLQLPFDANLKSKLVENIGVSVDSSRSSRLCSLVDGFAEYDPRAFSLLEEAASLGIVPHVSFKANPIIVDTRNMKTRIAEVYLLTVLRGLKHRLAAGSKLPSVNVLFPVEKAEVMSAEGVKTINLAERMSQEITSLLRRLGLAYQGSESYGKIRINGLSLKRWFQPKLAATPFSVKPGELSTFQLGKGISRQQRDIRIGNL